MFYNKPINLTTIVMDYTINKNLKLFNNVKYLTSVMQDYIGKTYECVLRPSQSLSQSLFQKNQKGNYTNSKLDKLISTHIVSTKVHTLL